MTPKSVSPCRNHAGGGNSQRGNPSGTMSRAGRLPLAALTLALLAVSACGGDEQQNDTSEPVTPVEVLLVQPRTFTEDVEVTGEVQALDDVTLTAQAPGTIEQLVPLGTSVSEGGTVARLDDDEAQAGVAEAQAAVRSAEAGLARTQDRYDRLAPLVADTIVAPVEFEGAISERDRASASVRQAEARLRSARQRLEETRLTSPIDGRVEEHFVEPGEIVRPGDPVARVVSPGELRVRAGIPEIYAGRVEEGTSVVVRLRGPDAGTRRGRIAFVSTTVDPQGQTFEIEVALPADTPLTAGQVVQIAVPLRQIERALFVPRAAVALNERGASVFIVDRGPDSLQTDSTRVLIAARRPVTLGPGSGGLVVVTRGLQEQEEVIVLGFEDLVGGERVRVEERYTNPEAAARPLGGDYDAGGLADPSGRVPPAAPGPDLPGYAPPRGPARDAIQRDAGGGTSEPRR